MGKIKKKNKGRFFKLALLAVFLFMPFVSDAAVLTKISDVISASAPLASSNHTINFTLTNQIPSGGKIIITPRAGYFNIPAGLDYEDIDLSYATFSGGPYLERDLYNVATGSADIAAVVTGYSGNLTFTLNSVLGLSQGIIIRIKIGTNANHQSSGFWQIINPSVVGSYKISIETQDSFGAKIDDGGAMITVVDPVTLSSIRLPDVVPPVRSNGLPVAYIPLEITQADISLQTNEYAWCRYSLTADTNFASMSDVFSTTLATLHIKTITGLQDNSTYTFYVRCLDNGLNANMDDYIISFTVKIPVIPPPGDPPGGIPPDNPTPPSSSGKPYPAPLLAPQVTLEGLAYPLSEVVLIRDNVEDMKINANFSGEFKFSLSGLIQGTHTFGIKAKDSRGNYSTIRSVTVGVVSDSISAVTGILISPTTYLSTTTLDAGVPLAISGESFPSHIVEIEIYSKNNGGITGTIVKKIETNSDENGRWQVTYETGGLSTDTYIARVRGRVSAVEASDYGKIYYFGIGKQPEVLDTCGRADLNKDGKVNLTDFSILLFHWETNNEDADINLSGKVDLVDFSIMLFCWTG